MRQILMLVAVAGFVVACATSPTEHPPQASGFEESTKPLAAVVPQRLADQTGPPDVVGRSDDPPDRSRTPSGTDPHANTIESTAARAVVELLEDEGLLALDIQTETTEELQTTILTTVLYGTGRSHPREATYLVELEASDRIWTIVSIEAVP